VETEKREVEEEKHKKREEKNSRETKMMGCELSGGGMRVRARRLGRFEMLREAKKI
jgi:hypothetical protein